jgi:hypothetical protein
MILTYLIINKMLEIILGLFCAKEGGRRYGGGSAKSTSCEEVKMKF